MKNGQRIRGEGGKSGIVVQPDDGVAYPGAFDVRLFDIVFEGIDFRGAHLNAWYNTSNPIPTGKEVDITTSFDGGAVIRGNGYDRCKILNCTFRYFNFSNDIHKMHLLLDLRLLLVLQYLTVHLKIITTV